MNTHADKTQKNMMSPTRQEGSSTTQKSSNGQLSGKATFLPIAIGIVDNRPEAIAQRILQEMANNSPQVKQASQLQAMANSRAVPILQKQSKSEEEELQMKAAPIQKKNGDDSPQAEAPVSEPVRKNNTGLPDILKSGIENLSGFSMDDVKVHYNSDKPATLQSYAYAQGTDIHLGSGQEKHLPHEAWHVVQQKQGRVRPTIQLQNEVNVNDDAGLEKEADLMGNHALTSSVDLITSSTKKNISKPIFQAKFEMAKITEKTTLRLKGNKDDDWDDKIGKSLAPGHNLLVNDSNIGKGKHNITYREAIDVNIKETENLPTRIDWVRNDKIKFLEVKSVQNHFDRKLSIILEDVENNNVFLKGKLNTQHTRNCLKKPLRYEGTYGWGFTDGNEFVNSYNLTIGSVFDKIKEGANFTASMIDYWKKKLGDEVTIESLSFTESDLHEHGLGVVFVKFKKDGGFKSKIGKRFAGDNEEFEILLKPEDKSLEKKLIGDQKGSAAKIINKLAKLKGDKALTTIKMETTEHQGSMIEKVQGESMSMKGKKLAEADQPGSSENMSKEVIKNFLPKNYGIVPAFHETMVFAFIAGIGDLHFENVFFDNIGKPYLIDADNVLEHNQMEKEGTGEQTQSGFSAYNQAESQINQNAMKKMDYKFTGSALFTTLINNQKIRDKIFSALREAVAGKIARVVPIGTIKWAPKLVEYKMRDSTGRNELLDNLATVNTIVNGTYNGEFMGSGLKGTCKADANEFISDTEKAQLKVDFDGGTIPFYNYHFDSGEIKHNGEKICTGQTAEDALNQMKKKFEDAAKKK